MKLKLIIISGIILLTTVFLCGCNIHDIDTEEIEFYNGEVIVTIGNAHHVANDDFVLINFYKNSTYKVTINYSIPQGFGFSHKTLTETLKIEVPFTPYSWRFERDILHDVTVDIKELK